jgi:hypothetical protein
MAVPVIRIGFGSVTVEAVGLAAKKLVCRPPVGSSETQANPGSSVVVTVAEV